MLPQTKYNGLRFGVFEANLELHELRKNGLRIKLTGQSFQALIMLLERHGEVVTRDELRTALWPDEPWGDHDQRVNKIINKIREALCDSAEVPRYLTTIPRVGYRFLIPVEIVGAKAEADEAPALQRLKLEHQQFYFSPAEALAAQPPTSTVETFPSSVAPEVPTASRSQWKWQWSVIALALCAAIGIGGFRTAGKQFTNWRISEPTPLTTYVGTERQPSFSPDGAQVTFAWDNDNRSNFHIYTTGAGGGAARQITDGAHSDSNPVWSPTGNQIAFLRELTEGQAEVWIVGSDGNGANKIVQIDRPSGDHLLSWTNSPDWLVVSARPSKGQSASLFLMNTKTKMMRQLTFSSGIYAGDLSPAVSRDGSKLAFTRSTSPSWRDIFVLNLAGNLAIQGTPVRQTDLRRIIDSVAWTPDSRNLVFDAATTVSGARHLFLVDGTSAALNRNFAETGIEGDHPAIAWKGTKLAYVRKNIEQSSIWRLELRTDSDAPKRFRMVSSTRRDFTADMSPDGKRLVFSSVRSGPSEIWISDTDGSNLKRITSLGGSTPRWSPDGRRIAFESNTRGQPDIYVFTLADNKIQLLTTEGAANLRPSWSRNGKFIYFGSNRSGKSQIWKVPSEGGDAIQITRQGGIYAVETLNGKSIYYTSTDPSAVIRTASANGGEETEVIRDVTGYSTIAMANDGLYYLSSLTSTGAQLDFYTFATRNSRPLATIDKPIHRFLTSPPDGRFVLYTQVDQRDSDLMLIDPFLPPTP